MASKATGFLALENRYIIEGKLKFDGAVHVGSGYEGAGSDAEFVRGAFKAKQPFLPGSSLRGVLRSTLERILQAAKPESACVLFAEESHGSCFTVNRKLLKDYEADWEKRKLNPADREAELLEALGEGGQCDVCKLFGSPLMASKLRIDDCKLHDGGKSAVRHGVGIDRDTETAAPQIKYDFETFDGGPRFHLRMQIENAGQSDLALLGVLLHEMREGIQVGGKRSRGLGRCKLEGYQVSYFDKTTVLDFLKTGKPKAMNNFETQVLGPAMAAYFKEGAHAAATA
jgi:CRISPR-associated RAMP protein (TIGR02581 family)